MVSSRPRSAGLADAKVKSIRRAEDDSPYRHHDHLTTTPFVSPSDVKRTLGTVTATIVRGPGFFGQLGVDWADMTGGRSLVTERVFDEMHGDVMERLYERAVRIGGNSVIGVDFSIQEFGRGVFVVSAAGTAVIVG